MSKTNTWENDLLLVNLNKDASWRIGDTLTLTRD